MKFTTTILTAGKTATGIEVPPHVVAALGAGKRPPVRVTLRGYTYRSTVAVMGGRFMVGVNAGVREAAGVAGGDTLDVDIHVDRDPRDVDVPADLADLLAGAPGAHDAFDALSPSRKRAHVGAIEGAKTAETRQRRLQKVVDELQARSR